jgi:hypothetical protein
MGIAVVVMSPFFVMAGKFSWEQTERSTAMKKTILIAALLLGASTALAFDREFGAAAVYIHDANGTIWITAGTQPNAPSAALAREYAVKQCEDAARKSGIPKGGCRIVKQWKTGECGFISVTEGGQHGGMFFGTGSSPAEAKSECESHGYTCGIAQGGCNDGSGRN